MATTGFPTNRELIGDALRKINVVANDEEMEPDYAKTGLRQLNRMLKSWQNYGYNIWAVSRQSLVLAAGAEQTLDPVRPLRINSARFVNNGTDLPMIEINRQQYDRLPNKDATGTPVQFYYDRQREQARMYVWPTTAGGETVEVTYERELEDQTDLNAEADVPSEWLDAVVYNLAARLADDFSRDKPMVVRRAQEELRLALASDREDSVFFGMDEYADY